MGMLIGGITVIFALQNTAAVTLTLISDRVTAPLGLIVLGAVFIGVAMTLFAMLPHFIQEALEAYAERRRQRLEVIAEYEASAPEQAPSN